MFTLPSSVAIGADLYLEIWKWKNEQKALGIFPGLQHPGEWRSRPSGIPEPQRKPKRSQCSQEPLTNEDTLTHTKKKERKKNKRAREKALLRSKRTEKLVQGPYNYQGNGDMGSPLTQERKREMLDSPRKHSWKAKLRLPNRGDISKCVSLSHCIIERPQ